MITLNNFEDKRQNGETVRCGRTEDGGWRCSVFFLDDRGNEAAIDHRDLSGNLTPEEAIMAMADIGAK